MSEHTREPAVVDGWRPVVGSRAYAAILEQIEERILAGSVRVGDRLPAEREFAEVLGVSRSAVREAIRTLETQGVLRSSVGAGRGGGTVVVASAGASLARLLRLHVSLGHFPMPHIVEARIMLERESAALAARHHDEDILAELERLVAAMEDPAIEQAAFNAHDTRLHVAIAEAGGNRLVADMTTAIRASMEASILASFHDRSDWQDVRAELSRGHRALLTAVARRDAQVAADVVETHIRYAFSTLAYDHEA